MQGHHAVTTQASSSACSKSMCFILESVGKLSDIPLGEERDVVQ